MVGLLILDQTEMAVYSIVQMFQKPLLLHFLITWEQDYTFFPCMFHGVLIGWWFS